MLLLTAKYTNRYNFSLYALAIEGSHTHQFIHTPDKNRAHFMRDLNSNIAKQVPLLCPEYPGGRLWERRYSSEMVPMHRDDIEEQFFYTVLQPVKDGLVSRLSEYAGYSCFSDAIHGRKRCFKEVDWKAFNKARRLDKKAKIEDFETSYYLEYKRLPGYEDLTQKKYAKIMNQKLFDRENEIIKQRELEGRRFLGKEALVKMKPGTPAKNPKLSERFTKRPRVLSMCPKRREEALDFYFDCYEKFKKASVKYRYGDFTVEFPKGMYRPYCCPH